MTAITLMRSDPKRNMHRYYRLDVQPDLFGAWCCIREWGRIGQAGQIRSSPYPTLPPPRRTQRLHGSAGRRNAKVMSDGLIEDEFTNRPDDDELAFLTTKAVP